MEMCKYKYRIVARITVEAMTPLAIGSGESAFITDSLVTTDINGMPYIPGSSLAGVLRHAVEDTMIVNDFFGFQNGNQGAGSKIVFSDGLMVGENGKVLDGIQALPLSEFYELYRHLPVRQHVRIGHKGTHEDKGKFDEQVVLKGTRFVFDMELVSDTHDKDSENFTELLRTLHSGNIRFGGGTRKGFGKLRPVSCLWREYDLTTQSDLEEYLKRSARLDIPWNADGENILIDGKAKVTEQWTTYELSLTPRDFFLFSSGMGDNEADMVPVTEPVITWVDEKPVVNTKGILIPASSIKGALAHRVAYHWFKKKRMYADNDNTSWDNKAVKTLFGSSGDGVDNDDITAGNVLLDDIFINDLSSKVINHVAIDRFTGGALKGALFTEKVSVGKDSEPVVMYFYVKNSALADEDTRCAWEMTLSDLCNGLLPLGGGVNRGNGIFMGSYRIK